TITGLTAIFGILFVTLGVPHLVVNFVKLWSDLKRVDYSSYRSQGIERLAAIRQSFISRQNQLQAEYIHNLAVGDARANGTELHIDNSPETERLITEIIIKAQAQDQGWFARILSRNPSDIVNKLAKKSAREIQSLAGAIRHFIFSYA